jgi:hypothetical protein
MFGVIFIFTFQLDVLSYTFFFGFQPSMNVFKNMLHELSVGRENPDGADQGFLASYFPDLLDQPMFHPPANGTKLQGTYRLPLGYQMDASYYCECLQQNGYSTLSNILLVQTNRLDFQI